MTPEVLIVGGGPAGLASALAFGRLGVGTLLVERRRFPIDKPCGEGLLPSAITELAGLGVAEADLTAAGVPIAGVEYHAASGRVAAADFARSRGIGVRRIELSRLLVSAARRQRSVEILEGRAAALSIGRDGRVEAQIGADRLRPRLVVVADGLGARAARSIGIATASGPVRRWGIRRHCGGEAWTSRVEVHFARGCEAYVTPVRDGVNVAILWEPRRVLLPRGVSVFDALLERFPALRVRVAGRPAIDQGAAAGPFCREPRAHARAGVVLAGDAGGYLDPMTGEGVGLAVLQARVLARHVAPELEAPDGSPVRAVALDRVHAEVRRRTRPHRQLTRVLLSLARRPVLVEAAIGALAADPVLFSHCLAANMGERAAWRVPPASVGRLVAAAVIDLAAVRP